MKQTIRWLLFDTQAGDLVLRALEHFVGLALMGTSIPDAIGWKSYESYLVECKASRNDFLADQKKFHRRYPEKGMGNVRFYMTSPGLLSPDEIPDKWGLLEVQGRCVRVIKHAYRFTDPQIARNERALMYKLLREALESQ